MRTSRSAGEKDSDVLYCYFGGGRGVGEKELEGSESDRGVSEKCKKGEKRRE